MKKITLGAAIVAAAALLLTGCSGAADSGGSTGTAGATGGAGGGTTDITVGVLPVPDTAAMYLGVDQGFFKDEGLNVTLQPTTGGAAAVPGVVSGEYDFAFGNYLSGMVAVDQGLPLQYVTNATAATKTDGFQAVVVPKDSDIKSPKDLTGKRVSVNNLSNINDTTIRGVVDADGGDSSKIEFVEVAFPDAQAAILNKQVDAGTVNPWVKSMESDFRVITYNFTDFTPDLDIAGFFTNTKTVSENPDLVKKFQTAMNKSLEFAQANPDKVRAIILTYTKLTKETVDELDLPVFRTEVNKDSLKTLADAAVKYGTIKKVPDWSTFLW
ncbi:ABC transporter substrate-binding protein [Microbacterium gorillae]|uniref:ABC transporter substrate-binding protein n=1 Tax=Microbacterium gorillae TaxID=1231063 RepID=UPI00058F72D4|nr:ABC transporter substrate-binding protein [Microbacterium gorillae]